MSENPLGLVLIITTFVVGGLFIFFLDGPQQLISEPPASVEEVNILKAEAPEAKPYLPALSVDYTLPDGNDESYWEREELGWLSSIEVYSHQGSETHVLVEMPCRIDNQTNIGWIIIGHASLVVEDESHSYRDTLRYVQIDTRQEDNRNVIGLVYAPRTNPELIGSTLQVLDSNIQNICR